MSARGSPGGGGAILAAQAAPRSGRGAPAAKTSWSSSTMGRAPAPAGPAPPRTRSHRAWIAPPPTLAFHATTVSGQAAARPGAAARHPASPTSTPTLAGPAAALQRSSAGRSRGGAAQVHRTGAAGRFSRSTPLPPGVPALPPVVARGGRGRRARLGRGSGAGAGLAECHVVITKCHVVITFWRWTAPMANRCPPAPAQPLALRDILGGRTST